MLVALPQGNDNTIMSIAVSMGVCLHWCMLVEHSVPALKDIMEKGVLVMYRGCLILHPLGAST